MNELIIKNDGTKINWSKTKDNDFFCLLYNDDKKTYSFTPTTDINCQLFMIGGGGAGGYFFGGGGGAGSAYINNNYTFNKGITYTFEIGTGGKCDIDNIDNLFKSGLSLTVYNNTMPDLKNLSFMYDDYSALNINSSGMVQSFPVNSINIPSTIWNNNTTYIWKGYLKTSSPDGYIKINVNSKINTYLWIDNYICNNNNSLVQGDNIADIKVIKVEPNKFYTVTIIAYCNNNNITNNFNIVFNNCDLFNLDKTAEKYNYIPATDTKLSFIDNNNIQQTIICKGGGNGGCGFYNQNTNLNGGCGGGSGINKINGSAIIDKYNLGNDGAIGDFCGGGGGIISKGNNATGGDGKILYWFNDNLIFGAGGNGANIDDNRSLGYGCGGNGGGCCYYSKLMINNNGNNGCVLIYLKPVITEKFDIINNNAYSNFVNKDFSVMFQLINNSYNITEIAASNGLIDASYSRLNYFNNDTLAKLLISNDGHPCPLLLIFCHKIVATTYKLFDYHFKNTLHDDPNLIQNFLDNLSIVFTNDITGKSYIDNEKNILYLNSVFNCKNLSDNILNDDITASSLFDFKNKYADTFYGLNNKYPGTVNITKDVFLFNNNDDMPPIPIYHHIPSFSGNNVVCSKLKYINDYIKDYDFTNSNILDFPSPFNKEKLREIITNYYNNNYYNNKNLALIIQKEQFIMYLLDIILNNSKDNILPALYYQTLNLSIFIINFNLQYGLFKLQYSRITCTTTGITTNCTKATNNINIMDYVAEIQKSKNTINNIKTILNNPNNFLNFKNNVSNIISENNINTAEFADAQFKLNKIIQDYNTQLELYNDIIKGYKTIITGCFILLIFILFIFGSSAFSNSTKIMILSIIIFIIIVSLIIYAYYNNVQEPFVNNTAYSGISANLNANIDISGYRSSVKTLHDSVVIPILSTLDINSAVNPAITYIKNMQIIKKKKIQYYNNKTITLKNSIEILKKSRYYYYFMIILLSVSIVVLIFSLIFYLLFPNLYIYNFILTFIVFVILLYYIFYNIHKSTRLKENKNYWANFNPTNDTLNKLL